MSNKKRIFTIFFLIIGILAPVSIVYSSKSDAASSVTLSLSIGLPHDGALKNAEVLPAKGEGYRLMQTARERKARFGVSELISLIKWSTFKVHSKYQGAQMAVGDLSRRTGGEAEHHASHQNGRDVDFAFYVLNSAGQSVGISEMIPFDKNGYAIDPPMAYRFDVRRNWALVEALITSSKAQVQWIFVAEHLETLLLAHAAACGASKQTIWRAEQIMKQPSKSSHWDHFHVRIYCPANDKPECRDFGPKWGWLR
ncbi:MAG: penicillin-insensitive murein endopeptidase [Deltaproteobacteria bacterium]|nr:penicillin-insensitive murein endopeptidase [Deltaproteobacteria bacterium]